MTNFTPEQTKQLELFSKILDSAFSSDDESVKDALGALMTMTILVHSADIESTPGPLTQALQSVSELTVMVGNLNRRIDLLESKNYNQLPNLEPGAPWRPGGSIGTSPPLKSTDAGGGSTSGTFTTSDDVQQWLTDNVASKDLLKSLKQQIK